MLTAITIDGLNLDLSTAGLTVGLLSDVIRYLSFLLDMIPYSLIPVVFDLIYNLYDLSERVASVDAIKNLANSLYSFLAIFMFFKVAFSLLGMLVDPNMIADKEKGAGKLISGIFITLVLIVVVPLIFDYATKAQSIVMEKNLIEKAVFGEDYSRDITLGKRVALATWGLFLQKTTDSGDAVSAYEKIFEEKDPEVLYVALFKNINKTTNSIGFWQRALKAYAGSILIMGVPGGGTIEGIKLEMEAFGIGDGTTRYQISYIAIVSTICGFYLLWTFIKMCIDVAYRAIKLYALRMISPIAIISYIDLKSGKNGVFSKWLAECVKTYISLFVRVFVFAIASVILTEIDITSAGDIFIERLFFILAVVAFIKTAPKFIDGILGTELSKDSESKFGSDLLKQGLGGLGMATVGGAVGLASAKKLGYNGGRGFWEGAKAGFTGGVEAVNKKDPIGVMSGLVKAGNGANAMRKYYGLPTAAEARKQKTEADLAMVAAKKFTANKNAVSQKAFDKMEEPDFKKHIEGLTDTPENNIWKDKWNKAASNKERAIIKKQYTESLFNQKNNDAGAAEALEKLNPSRSALFRASYGTQKAVAADFGENSDIGKAWIKEEDFSRKKLMFEQEVENWGDLAQRADTVGGKLYHVGDNLDDSNPNSYYDSVDDALRKNGIKITKYTMQVDGEDVEFEDYTKDGIEYKTVEEAMAAANLTDLKAIGIQDFQEQKNLAQGNANNASKQKDDAAKEKEEAMKIPKNAAAARKAKLIMAGKDRGY